MSKIHFKKAHSLAQEEARRRVEEIAKGLKKEYKIDYEWQDDRLLFRRKGAAGYLYLGDGFIELNIKLGVALAALKSKIEKTIKTNVAIEMAEEPGSRSS